MRLGRHGLQDLGQAWDQALPVRLVHLVLHREVDLLCVRRRLAERRGQEGYPLQVEDDVCAGVCGGQDAPGFGRGDLELRDDGDGLDLLRPGELLVVADADRGFWWFQSRVHSSFEFWEDFTEGDLFPLCVFWTQVVQIRADESSI